MKIEKWRDLSFDIKEIKFNNFKLLDITSYPYAQNDVIEIEIEENRINKQAFLKYERSKKANLKEEYNILKYLHKNNLYNNIPKIIDAGTHKNKDYIVLEKLDGDKLSIIFKNSIKDKITLLSSYCEELAKIHKINIKNINKSMKRNINYIPKEIDYNLDDIKIKKYINYLINNDFKKCNKTFIHGDFHYGNVLFKDKVSGVLDWEYAGLGLKEQDIAWALIFKTRAIIFR